MTVNISRYILLYIQMIHHNDTLYQHLWFQYLQLNYNHLLEF